MGMTSRRVFLRNGGLALVSLGFAPTFLPRAVLAAPARKKLLVAIFQRGGVDGLNVVVPYGEPAYYQSRPFIAVPRPGCGDGAIDLDGFFALHPRLAPLEALYRDGTLAIVHACGSADGTRSHLEAQDHVESVIGQLGRFGPPERATGTTAASFEDPTRYRPDAGARYPASAFGQALRQIARLARADVGLQIAVAETGNWDHHVDEGSTQGLLANRLDDLGRGLAAFVADLGPRMSDTVIVTMSEFGRALHENGNGGTDHGHGNAMLVMGAGVKGGRVYARWPGLDRDHLYEGRDLAVTTDFRDVLAEIVTAHLAVKDPAGLFPGYANEAKNRVGFMCRHV
jgi:uncharacterized protein (DUF1501 family)